MREPLILRILHITAATVFLAASGVVLLCVEQWRRDDPQLKRIRSEPSVVELFKDGATRRGSNFEKEVSPLVAQAREFASHLNPLSPPAGKNSSDPAPPLSLRATPAVRPAAPSLQFALQGTSYYPDQPGKSMALVSEPGGSEADGRWVKEGDRLGHFVVHEIRKGTVVFRSGDDLRKLALERRWASRSLARDVCLGWRQANAATDKAYVDVNREHGCQW